MNQVRAWAPGTAGELVQGWLDGEAVQVTAPIDSGSTAIVTPGSRFRLEPHLPKLHRAVRLLLDRHNLRVNGTIRVHNALPVGKGFGSSTADITAGLAAVAASCYLSLSPEEIATIALEIEPTDGVMFDGIVLWGQRAGSRLDPLGSPPPCHIFIDDGVGRVNTSHFAAHDRSTPESERITAEAVTMIRAGMNVGDLSVIGQAATLSAVAHQRVLFKPGLDQFQVLGKDIGALGVCVGHSGTLMGLLIDPKTVDSDAAAHWLSSRWPRPLRRVSLISGGVRVVRPATLPV